MYMEMKTHAQPALNTFYHRLSQRGNYFIIGGQRGNDFVADWANREIAELVATYIN